MGDDIVADEVVGAFYLDVVHVLFSDWLDGDDALHAAPPWARQPLLSIPSFSSATLSHAPSPTRTELSTAATVVLDSPNRSAILDFSAPDRRKAVVLFIGSL